MQVCISNKQLTKETMALLAGNNYLNELDERSLQEGVFALYLFFVRVKTVDIPTIRTQVCVTEYPFCKKYHC